MSHIHDDVRTPTGNRKCQKVVATWSWRGHVSCYIVDNWSQYTRWPKIITVKLFFFCLREENIWIVWLTLHSYTLHVSRHNAATHTHQTHCNWTTASLSPWRRRDVTQVSDTLMCKPYSDKLHKQLVMNTFMKHVQVKITHKFRNTRLHRM